MSRLILASGSAIRAEILRRAGIDFTVETSAVDEDEIKASFRAENRPAAECAIALAEAKAARVSRRNAGALVIGADQMLVCDGVWYDKPVDRLAARKQLLDLRGKRHELVGAICVLRNGRRLWHVVECSALMVRNFSDDFLDDYLDASGDAILASVGAYQLEGRGVQLFERVEGDFFAILGLPLLPLLAFLRGHGIVAS